MSTHQTLHAALQQIDAVLEAPACAAAEPVPCPRCEVFLGALVHTHLADLAKTVQPWNAKEQREAADKVRRWWLDLADSDDIPEVRRLRALGRGDE